MNLSEAIRLGALLKPQGHMGFLDQRSGGTCALGAATDAIGRLNDLLDGRFYEFREWPVLGATVESPETGWRTTVWQSVVTLNDLHGWTRERIADWVETIEAQQEQPEALQALSLVGVGIGE